MNGVVAVQKLRAMGYDFELAGDRLRYQYHGPGEPDPAQVRPLLEVVKAHKPDVLAYLSKPAMPERVLTCADCGFHQYSGPNPRQGFGQCTYKGKGCYGLRPACPEIQPCES
ncbi:MAG: hypothetical protein WBW55_03720 [Desulfobaccales bacterium]